MNQFSARKLAAELYQTLKGYSTLLKTAPGDISEILYKLKQGEIKHELQFTDMVEIQKMLRNIGLPTGLCHSVGRLIHRCHRYPG